MTDAVEGKRRLTARHGSFRAVIPFTTTVWDRTYGGGLDLRDSRATDIGNTSATTFAGKVVGDSIMEPNDVKLYGLKSIAGSTIFSWASKIADLQRPAISKIGWYLDLHAHRRTCSHLINETSPHWLHKLKEYRLTHVVPFRLRSSKTFIDPRNENSVAPVVFQT